MILLFQTSPQNPLALHAFTAARYKRTDRSTVTYSRASHFIHLAYQNDQNTELSLRHRHRKKHTETVPFRHFPTRHRNTHLTLPLSRHHNATRRARFLRQNRIEIDQSHAALFDQSRHAARRPTAADSVGRRGI
jgi:hypothetical protein